MSKMHKFAPILSKNYGKIKSCGALAYKNLFSCVHYSILNHFCLYNCTVFQPFSKGNLIEDRLTIFYAPINVNPQRGGGRAYVGYLIINCIPTLGILNSILAPSWDNLNRMTFINIVFIAKWCGI
jgi:hypothetical protein